MRLKIFIHRLLQPKTGIYILLGVLIMFFTFFTNDNALEIAISGIASIFIGIGVNNFTQVETHEKDEAEKVQKVGMAIKVLEHTKQKLSNTEALLTEQISLHTARQQVGELKDYIELSIEQLKG